MTVTLPPRDWRPGAYHGWSQSVEQRTFEVRSDLQTIVRQRYVISTFYLALREWNPRQHVEVYIVSVVFGVPGAKTERRE